MAFNFAPFIVPMAIGALSSMASGRNPIEGAAVGAATQGLLGGIDFGGASSLFSSAGSSGVANTTTPVMGGLPLSGASSAIPNSFSAAVPTATASGVSTSLPQTAGQYSSIYGGDAALQNYDMGMNNVTSQLNTGASTAPLNIMPTVQETDLANFRNSYMKEVNPSSTVPQAKLDDLRDSYMSEVKVDEPKTFTGLLDGYDADDAIMYTQLANAAYNRATDMPDVEAQNLPVLQAKQVSPSEGRLLAINASRPNRDIKFYG